MPSPPNILCETQEQPRLAEKPDDNNVRYYLHQLKQAFDSNPTTHKRATIHLASMKYHPTASASVTHFFCFCDAFLLDAKSEVVPSSLRVVFLPHPGGVFLLFFRTFRGSMLEVGKAYEPTEGGIPTDRPQETHSFSAPTHFEITYICSSQTLQTIV